MARFLHIVHVIEKNRLLTGSVQQMMEAAAGLAARGHSVTVAGRPGGDLEAACTAAGLGFFELGLSHPFDVVSAISLRRRLRSRPAHIVHVHKGRAHAVTLMAATGLGRRPAVVVNRGVSFPLDLLNRWKYRHPRVAAVVCVAEAISVTLRDSVVDRSLVHTIHAGTDCQRFDPEKVDGSAVRSEIGVADLHTLITQVSVREWKGWRILLEGFARLTPQHPEARLLLVGCESEAVHAEVTRAAGELGVRESVSTLGFRRDMPEVLAASNVVVDASWAGTGVTGTIREAMAMQRPVIATDCGGNRELVIDGEVGLLVPPHDSEHLAEALNKVLENRTLRKQYGRAARQRVLDGFTTEHRLDRLEALYRSLNTHVDNRLP